MMTLEEAKALQAGDNVRILVDGSGHVFDGSDEVHREFKAGEIVTVDRIHEFRVPQKFAVTIYAENGVVNKLRANGKATRAAQRAGRPEPDHAPVVKVFNPAGAATWLLTEIDGDDDKLFGLCDLGMQSPELGTVSRSELEETRVHLTLRGRNNEVIRSKVGIPLERDQWFSSKYPISVWALAAKWNGTITDRPLDLKAAADMVYG